MSKLNAQGKRPVKSTSNHRYVAPGVRHVPVETTLAIPVTETVSGTKNHCSTCTNLPCQHYLVRTRSTALATHL